MLLIGPASQRACLRAGVRRLGAIVAALLLGLRASRGLHHGSAGVRDDLGSHSGVLGQADLSATNSSPHRRSRSHSCRFTVWAHHMFAVGMGNVYDLVLRLHQHVIAVPTGIKIFNWTVTLYGGRIRFTTSMMFALGFSYVHDRRAHGDELRGDSDRLATHRHLLPGRAFSLRAVWRNGVRDLRGTLLLVPEDFGPDARSSGSASGISGSRSSDST